MRLRVENIEWTSAGPLPHSLLVEVFPEASDIRWEVMNYLEKNYGERPVAFDIFK